MMKNVGMSEQRGQKVSLIVAKGKPVGRLKLSRVGGSCSGNDPTI
jgi:hypothetical protein